MEKYKTGILTVSEFLESRPDMEVHSERSIQSCIYTSASMLNAETNGLINDVWNFNHPDSGSVDNTNPLYRTESELAYLKDAFILQTQYTLNIGNDFSRGGGSYSIGNINASENRPDSRAEVAPGVYKLLENAKVYKLQDYNFKPREGVVSDPLYDYDTKPITQEFADNRYVFKYQKDADEGTIATINNAHIVVFSKPEDLLDGLNIQVEKANQIYDPKTGTYKSINDFLISYWDGMTREEIYTAITSAGLSWSPDVVYRKDFTVIFQVDGEESYQFARSLQDNNQGHNPNTSPEWWEILPTTPTDINTIIEYITNYINNLPSLTIINEAKGDILQFESQADFQTYKQQYRIDDTYFADVQVDDNNIARRDEQNIFTEMNTFDGDVYLNGGDMHLETSNITGNFQNVNWNYSYVNGSNITHDFIGGKNNIVFDFQQANDENAVQFNAGLGTTRIEFNGNRSTIDVMFDKCDLSLSGGSAIYGRDETNYIRFLGDPQDNTDAANKQYVDNQISSISTIKKITIDFSQLTYQEHNNLVAGANRFGMFRYNLLLTSVLSDLTHDRVMNIVFNNTSGVPNIVPGYTVYNNNYVDFCLLYLYSSAQPTLSGTITIWYV